jgi:hypothetical protein
VLSLSVAKSYKVFTQEEDQKRVLWSHIRRKVFQLIRAKLLPFAFFAFTFVIAGRAACKNPSENL